MLSAKNLSFNYGSKKILNGLDLSITKNEIAALIGPSGSGKTTFFKIVSGMLNHYSGTVSASDLSFMTQDDRLLPWRTVLKNIELPLEIEGRSKEKALHYLDSMELLAYKDLYPHELSGGMYKRVMLARALAVEKPLLLLDEPFSSLDIALRDKLYEFLRTIPSKTIVLITHDFRDALSFADRVLQFSQGKIINEWAIDRSQKDDPYYTGMIYQKLKTAVSVQTRL